MCTKRKHAVDTKQNNAVLLLQYKYVIIKKEKEECLAQSERKKTHKVFDQTTDQRRPKLKNRMVIGPRLAFSMYRIGPFCPTKVDGYGMSSFPFLSLFFKIFFN